MQLTLNSELELSKEIIIRENSSELYIYNIMTDKILQANKTAIDIINILKEETTSTKAECIVESLSNKYSEVSETIVLDFLKNLVESQILIVSKS